MHKNQFKAAAIFHEDKLFNLIDTQKGSYKNKGSCWQGSGANPEADNWLDSTG